MIRSELDFFSFHAELGWVVKLENVYENCIPVFIMSWFISVFFRVRVRYQKRQKLQFETKLGMNSPFWCVPAEETGVVAILGTSQSVLETRGFNTAELLIQPNSTATIRWSRYLPNFMVGALLQSCLSSWVCFLKTVDILSIIQRAGKKKIPKHSFPLNIEIEYKEPKIGNYLLFGFSFKGMRNVFWRGLCFLTITSVLHVWNTCAWLLSSPGMLQVPNSPLTAASLSEDVFVKFILMLSNKTH